MYQGWKLIDKSISLKVWTTSQEVFSFFILSSQQTYLCFHCFPNFNLISVLIFHAIQTTEWNSQLEAWQRTYKFALQIKSLLAVMMFTCRIIVWLPLAPIFPTWWFWGVVKWSLSCVSQTSDGVLFTSSLRWWLRCIQDVPDQQNDHIYVRTSQKELEVFSWMTCTIFCTYS